MQESDLDHALYREQVRESEQVRVSCTHYSVQKTEYRIHITEYIIQPTEYTVHITEYRVQVKESTREQVREGASA